MCCCCISSRHDIYGLPVIDPQKYKHELDSLVAKLCVTSRLWPSIVTKPKSCTATKSAANKAFSDNDFALRLTRLLTHLESAPHEHPLYREFFEQRAVCSWITKWRHWPLYVVDNKNSKWLFSTLTLCAYDQQMIKVVELRIFRYNEVCSLFNL